ncbi:MAG: HRDC domain-containing protein, partial [Henriciella sp.]
TDCRRGAVRKYFGETNVKPCGVCDNCQREEGEGFDATRYAQMAVSAVIRCGQRIGRGRLIVHLTGQAKDGFDEDLSKLSTYGIGEALSKPAWNAVFDELLFSGLLAEGGDSMRPVIIVPDADEAKALFRGDREVWLREDPTQRKSRKAKRASASAVSMDMSERDRALFDALRDWRLETAKTKGVPPYVIFHDKTLAAIAQERPSSESELLSISGVGEKKASRYAAEIAELVAAAA